MKHIQIWCKESHVSHIWNINEDKMMNLIGPISWAKIYKCDLNLVWFAIFILKNAIFHYNVNDYWFQSGTLNVWKVNETTIYLNISIDGVAYLNFRDFNTYFSALSYANLMNFLNIFCDLFSILALFS